MRRHIQRISSILIVLAILLSLFVPISAKDIEIKDMKPTDEGYTEVQWVINQGWMSLTTGKFFPNSYVRRNEFAMILCKVTGDIKNLKNPTKPTFLDVPKTDKYYRYIETAKPNMTYFKTSKGLYFKPNTYLTREDAVMSIVKVMGYNTDEALASGADSEISLDDLIDDSDKVAPALVKYVSIAIQNELIDLREADGKTYFDPKKSITRKQLAMLLYNAYQKKDYSKSEEEIGDGVIDESGTQNNSNSTDKQSSSQSSSNTTTNNSSSKATNSATTGTTTSSVGNKWKPLNLDNVEVTTFAGDGWAAVRDGTVDDAAFMNPRSICSDDEGNYYIVDYVGDYHPLIRKITSDNSVITILDVLNNKLGDYCSVWFDNKTKKLYLRTDNKIFVADKEFKTIKEVLRVYPLTDSQDRFWAQGRIVNDGKSLYYNIRSRILRYNDTDGEQEVVSPNYVSSVYYNDKDGMLYYLYGKYNAGEGIIIDKIGRVNLYRSRKAEHFAGADSSSNVIVQGNNGEGKATEIKFGYITDILFDPTGNIFVADSGSRVLRMITPDGYVRNIAGIPGKTGYKDGPANQALFGTLTSICFDKDGNILVADRINHVIRKVIIRR